MKFLVFLAYPPAFAWVMAQTSSTPTLDPTFVLTQLGFGALVAGPFVYLWRDERKQRQSADLKLIDVLERQGPLLAEAADTLEKVQDRMLHLLQQERSSPPDSDDYSRALRRVERVEDDLREELRRAQQRREAT